MSSICSKVPSVDYDYVMYDYRIPGLNFVTLGQQWSN